MPTVTGLSLPIAATVVPGGAVGERVIPGGLKPGDVLVSVVQVTEGTPPVLVDRTAEFSISATKAGVIANAVTDTTGKFLAVTWLRSN